MIGALLSVYAAVSTVAVIMAALLTATGEFDEVFGTLGREGRIVLAIFVALLWPLLVLVCVAWVLRATGRGFAQIFRAVFPKRVELPEARTVKR